MYRPIGYDNILRNRDIHFLKYIPGEDFIALNTSSAIMSKGNVQHLNYDCYLILNKRSGFSKKGVTKYGGHINEHYYKKICKI